jgi:hypothetical protein
MTGAFPNMLVEITRAGQGWLQIPLRIGDVRVAEIGAQSGHVSATDLR